MPHAMRYKNLWGAQDSGYDQQRADLFKLSIALPRALGGIVNWSNDVEFAVKQFPFPELKQETIAVKFMNQTNHQIGPDTATAAITIPCRYAFNQATAQLLTKWSFLSSNQRTGGTAITSKIKSSGVFKWLIPNMAVQEAIGESESSDTMVVGLQYKLEGCMITGLKPSDANVGATGDSALVDLSFNLSIDRYYPVSLNNMVFKS